MDKVAIHSGASVNNSTEEGNERQERARIGIRKYWDNYRKKLAEKMATRRLSWGKLINQIRNNATSIDWESLLVRSVWKENLGFYKRGLDSYRRMLPVSEAFREWVINAEDFVRILKLIEEQRVALAKIESKPTDNRMQLQTWTLVDDFIQWFLQAARSNFLADQHPTERVYSEDSVTADFHKDLIAMRALNVLELQREIGAFEQCMSVISDADPDSLWKLTSDYRKKALDILSNNQGSVSAHVVPRHMLWLLSTDLLERLYYWTRRISNTTILSKPNLKLITWSKNNTLLKILQDRSSTVLPTKRQSK